MTVKPAHAQVERVARTAAVTNPEQDKARIEAQEEEKIKSRWVAAFTSSCGS